MTALATPLQTEYQLIASSLNSSCIDGSYSWGHCLVVGGNWLQSSAVHRVQRGVAKLSDKILLPAPKYLQSITFLPPVLTDGIKRSSSIFSFVLRLTNVLLCDPNTSNLDLSIHKTSFQSQSVQCLRSLPTLIFTLY